MTYKEQITPLCTDRDPAFTAWKPALAKYSMKLQMNSQQRLVEKKNLIMAKMRALLTGKLIIKREKVYANLNMKFGLIFIDWEIKFPDQEMSSKPKKAV